MNRRDTRSIFLDVAIVIACSALFWAVVAWLVVNALRSAR